MLERDVRKGVIKIIKAHGGTIRKVKWIGRRSAPDELVLIPGHIPFLVELKATGKGPTEAQWREMDTLRIAGFEVEWIDGVEWFKALLPRMRVMGERLALARAQPWHPGS